ncbi:unnamed protein product [Ceratitis capitata]|uniref:(Mediterranean fruit fly) hypothetical protein n=1 Tax=Ceratitis capitata TaxID=7213 RepID=A0A811U1A9_CERCA|nr:unnamed protein product [Ceratitis capitata]
MSYSGEEQSFRCTTSSSSKMAETTNVDKSEKQRNGLRFAGQQQKNDLANRANRAHSSQGVANCATSAPPQFDCVTNIINFTTRCVATTIDNCNCGKRAQRLSGY